MIAGFLIERPDQAAPYPERPPSWLLVHASAGFSWTVDLSAALKFATAGSAEDLLGHLRNRHTGVYGECAVRPCYYRAGEWSLDYGAAGI